MKAVSVVDCMLHGSTKIWRQSFWMRHWGSPSPKRTSIWSNSWQIRLFNKGRLQRAEMKKCNYPTSNKYKDRKGRARWSGNANLKSTQKPAYSTTKALQSSVVCARFFKVIWWICWSLLQPRTYTYKFARGIVQFAETLMDMSTKSSIPTASRIPLCIRDL